MAAVVTGCRHRPLSGPAWSTRSGGPRLSELLLSEEDAAKDARWSGEAAELARTLCRVADELKGRDVRALQVDAFVSWTRVMVFVTVTNRPQLLAMCAKMESAALEEHGCTLCSGHKPGGSTWELLDFGDVVVQIQSAEQRAYYNIEKLYAQGDDLELERP